MRARLESIAQRAEKKLRAAAKKKAKAESKKKQKLQAKKAKAAADSQNRRVASSASSTAIPAPTAVNLVCNSTADYVEWH